MSRADVEQVRSFNRAVTLRTGVLDSSYLGRGRPLGQARVLFEIGPDGSSVRTLREKLGLDSGHLSRLLRSLESEGMLSVKQDAEDRRVRVARLTQAGLAEHAAYDALSDALAASLLEPLGATQRRRLVAAMAEVEALMQAASIRIGVEPGDSPEAQQCLAAYFAELNSRFENGFDPSAGSPPRKTDDDRFLMARLHGRPVGCGVLKTLEPVIGEIKRMWVAPEARGFGLARRLLDTLEQEAISTGMKRVRLDTNRALAEAQALYRKSGYVEIARYNDNPYADFWFEKELSQRA